uniref:Uncharacterized protein n=1 Tax=Arundo donax TaxID=35708 RepID=A0A0A9CJ75_ARUDO
MANLLLNRFKLKNFDVCLITFTIIRKYQVHWSILVHICTNLLWIIGSNLDGPKWEVGILHLCHPDWNRRSRLSLCMCAPKYSSWNNQNTLAGTLLV